MLVIANGAPKSGSTWLFNILRHLKQFAEVPREFLLDPTNPNSELIYERLPDFLREVDSGSRNYLLKNHFGEAHQRDLILATPHVRVVNIKRDIKDAVVSWYYHEMRARDVRIPFARYYWRRGRYDAERIRRYHAVWEEARDERVLFSSYEALKNDFASEVRRIAAFVEAPLSKADLERVREMTSMERLRERYGDSGDIKFFRKGESGDWKNHFGRFSLRDITRVEVGGLDNSSFADEVFARLMRHVPLL
jgi:hypothetical protein